MADKDNDGNLAYDLLEVEGQDGEPTLEYQEYLGANSYYPFGLSFSHNTVVTENGDAFFLDKQGGVKNKYTYNGKEFLDDLDIGWHYYGFRVYDPAIARFTSVDPISDQFPNLSTFNYADNNPILNIDLHGLQGVKYTELDKKGREITVIEADIHIATGKGGFSDKQVRRITKKLNKAFDKKVDGTRVDVRFNVSTFDASNTNLKDKARKVRNSSLVKTAVTFETLEGTMTKSSITGMVLGKEALPAGDQGKTNVNLSVINPEADDMMHTTVHEVGHFLLLGSNEQPASFPEHQEAGGIFKYATKDLSGNVVGETHGVSRNNVRAILKNVPEKKQ